MKEQFNIVGIIPARYGSTRFPGKPLVEIAGQTMLQRVISQSRKAKTLTDVIVATDDQRIYDHVISLGEKAFMTSQTHPSGTDRCLDALLQMNMDVDAVINIQGDEPFIAPEQIEQLSLLIARPYVDIATLAKKITDPDTLFDSNKVKVIMNEAGRAIYFSRFAIPFQKGMDQKQWLSSHTYFKHIGLYAYKTDVLKSICTLNPSPLEIAESLEQLRWLESDRSIHVAITDIESPAIDTPEDLEKAILWMNQN
jgi:3-deoxy-manno-octulosonate cytidylyltransferase (CMP-KDO synthetase)